MAGCKLRAAMRASFAASPNSRGRHCLLPDGPDIPLGHPKWETDAP